MKRFFLSVVAIGAIAVSPIIATPVAAASAIVEQAKSECIVGEQSDGYLGFVPGTTASSALRREVRDINQQRKTVYANLARQNGVSVDVTAALTAEKLIRQARSGQCVQNQSGRWVEV